MADAGMKGAKPVINITAAPDDAKRKGEFWVNDIRSDIGRLNTLLGKAASVGIKVTLEVQVATDGSPRIALTSAVRP